MKSAIRGLAALIVISIGGVASAHTGHVHAGKVWVRNCEGSTPGVMGRVLGGHYETHMTGPLNCNSGAGFRGCGQCYPNCYLGTPCACCIHKVHYTLPCFKFGKLLAEEHAQGNTTKIESPGAFPRLRGVKTLQLAP